MELAEFLTQLTEEGRVSERGEKASQDTTQNILPWPLLSHVLRSKHGGASFNNPSGVGEISLRVSVSTKARDQYLWAMPVKSVFPM